MKKEDYSYFFIIVVSFLAITIIALIFPSFFYTWNQKINDNFFVFRSLMKKEKSIPSSTVNVFIDDAFIDKYHISDWNRDIYGHLIDTIKNYNPKIIACDILFKDALPEPLYARQNYRLLASTRDAGSVYYPVIVRDRKTISENTTLDKFIWAPVAANKGRPPIASTVVLPFDELLSSANCVGSINVNPDTDGIIRTYSLLYAYKNGYIPSFSLALACGYLGVKAADIEIVWGSHLRLPGSRFHGGFVKDVLVPIDESGKININFKGPWSETNVFVPASELVESPPSSKTREKLYNLMNDSIVIISDISTQNRDYNPGIFESVYPSTGVISAVIHSILTEDFIKKSDFVNLTFLYVIFIALLFVISILSKPAGFIIKAGVLLLFFLVYNAALFIFFNILPQMAAPGTAIVLAIIFITGYKLLLAEKHRVSMLEREVSSRTMELKDANSSLEESVGQLNEAIVQKDQAIYQKTNFFHNLAHEIKTPLTLIRNYMELSRTGAGLTRELEIVNDNIVKICRDVGNFFDSEKIEKGKVLYNHDQPADFSGLAEDAIILFNFLAKKRNVSIKASIVKGLYVQADPSSVDRIIWNLLDNAVKYSPINGHITVHLDNTSDGKVLFRVTNDGPSIPTEQRAHIFEPYFQLSRDKKSSQGMELGLPIVMGIVNQLGGTLQLDEDTGEGPSFAIVIPGIAGSEVKKGGVKPRQHVSSSADTPESFIEEESFNVEKQTILLVEDNVQLLSLLRSSFAAEYNVLCARNGNRALEILSSKPKPEIIVSDVIMDGLDGFALLEQVSKNEQWKSIPFIFLTAKTEKEEKLKALSGGAVDFITKPFAIEELVAKIKSILRHRSAQKESDIKEIEKKISHVLRKGDTKDIHAVLRKYDLTQKERKIIELLHLGLQYKEISDKANLSVAAVRKRVHGIYQKFNVQNRTELFLVIEKDA